MNDHITKESVNERFSALQEANRAKRQRKVTAEDVQQQIADRRAAGTGRRGAVVATCIGAALLIAAGVSAMTTTGAISQFEIETTRLSQQIIDAQSTLDTIPASEQESATAYSDALTAQISLATTKGREVAELQQQFAEILADDNQASTQGGAASDAITAAATHRKQLAPYFVDRSLIVDGSSAYAPVTANPFGAGKIDPRFPWFIRFEDGAIADPKSATWELASVQPTANTGVFTATWLNRDAAGDLLAWAKASYYTEAEQFGSLTVGTTTVGERSATALQQAGE